MYEYKYFKQKCMIPIFLILNMIIITLALYDQPKGKKKKIKKKPDQTAQQ